MRPEDVREHLIKKPFEPFRLFLSDGAAFKVDHPDMCIVSRSTVYVGIPDPKLPGVALRVAHCAMIHITRIEPLDGAKPKRTRRNRGE